MELNRSYTASAGPGSAQLTPILLMLLFTSPGVSQTWTQLSPAGQLPPGRSENTAVYDAASNRMLVFAGCAYPYCYLDDLWVLTNANGAGISSWIQLAPSGTIPASRRAHAAVFDSGNNRMIVFGGVVPPIGFVNEVWILKNANGLSGTPIWELLATAGTPPSPRRYLKVEYDSIQNRLIVFGGSTHAVYGANDVWVLSNANGLGGTPTWYQLTPSGTPPIGRTSYYGGFDPGSNRLIVFGGSDDHDGSTGMDDLWVLTNANGLGGTPVWMQLIPSGAAGSPPKSSNGAVVYDTLANELTIFGGWFAAAPFAGNESNEVWTLSHANGLGGTPAWTKRQPTGGPPPARVGHMGVYDAVTRRMTVFSGQWHDSARVAQYLTDTWVLSLASADTTPPAVAVTGVANTGVYTLGAVPAAGCSTSDSESGVAANATLSLTGGTSSGVGSFTATCSGARDNAGNVAPPVSVSYSVQYQFLGFFAPISMSAPNSAKAGQTIPAKWQVTNSNSSQVTSLSTVSRVGSVPIQCGGTPVGMEVPAETSGNSGLRYDSAAGQFVFSWQTEKAWAGSCQRLVLVLDDGTTHSADFSLK